MSMVFELRDQPNAVAKKFMRILWSFAHFSLYCILGSGGPFGCCCKCLRILMSQIPTFSFPLEKHSGCVYYGYGCNIFYEVFWESYGMTCEPVACSCLYVNQP